MAFQIPLFSEAASIFKFKFTSCVVRSSLYTSSLILTACSIIFKLASFPTRLVASMSSRGMRLRSLPSLVVSRAL